jgi:hypothetical protein
VGEERQKGHLRNLSRDVRFVLSHTVGNEKYSVLRGTRGE